MPAYKQDLDAIKIDYPILTATQNGLSNGIHVTKGANLNGAGNIRPPFKVCQDGVLGRHLVATRDIQPGEVILREAPLVTGPPLNFHPCCVSCYKGLTQENHMTCSKGCGWPVCSDECAKAPTHQPECLVTLNIRKEKVSIEHWEAPSSLFESLLVLRCLTFRDSNPALWTKLSKLEAHVAKRHGTPKWERERDSVARFLCEYFKLDYPEEDVLRICGVIQVNGYGVRLRNLPYIALYDELSFIEHHCIPNCSKAWSSTGALTVHTASFVPMGQHLSISYTNSLWGTADRRSHLVQELLLCKCSRCADPIECGTYYSALRCIKNSCEGYLLPEDSLLDVSSTVLSQHAGNSRWRCTKCDITQSPQQVDTVLEHFKKKLTVLNKADVGACEKLLQHGCILFLFNKLKAWHFQDGSTLFHDNHFYLTEVKILLAELIGQGPLGMKELSHHQLELKVTLCKQVLHLANILFPAVRRVTGLICFELYRAMSELSIRECTQSNGTSYTLSGRTENIFNEAQKALTEAKSILRCEPEILPELFYETREQIKGV